MVAPMRTSMSSETAAQDAQVKNSAQGLPTQQQKGASDGSDPSSTTTVDSESTKPTTSTSSETAAQDAVGNQSAKGLSTPQEKAAPDGSNPSNTTKVDPGSIDPTTSTPSESVALGAEGKQSSQGFSTQQPKAASDGSDPSNTTDKKGSPLRRSEPSPSTKEGKEDSESDLCIYPLSTEEKQFLIAIAEKHGSKSTDFDPNLLISILTAIYQLTTSELGFKGNGDQETENNLDTNTVNIGDDIRDVIQLLILVIGGKYAKDMELHETAINIFDVLMNRTWEDKVVLISAAFIIIYSEFSSEILERTHENPLVRTLSAPNKRTPQIKREDLSSTFMPLSNLVKKLLEVCTLMVQLKKDRGQRNIQDIEEKVMKVLHMVTYGIIKSVVTCSLYMESIKRDIGFTPSDRHINQQDSFLKELTDIHKYVTDFLKTIASREIQDSSPADIQDIHQFLRTFFSQDKVLNGGKVSLEELNGNTTAFLVSDLSVSTEKLNALSQTYTKTPVDKKFKIIWVPILDPSTEWNESEEGLFSSIVSSLQFYWCHPSMVPNSLSSHLTDEWHYQKEPCLVVLDEKANVKSRNALPLVEAWGASAFPFSNDVEASIKQGWTIERMIKDLEIKMNLENEIVCVYGGHDLEMNKSFAENVDKINSIKGNQIKSIYVGTNKQEKDLQTIAGSLQGRNTTCVSKDIMSTFWKRLSFVLKMMMMNGKTDEEDVVKKQLMTLLGYSGKDLWTMVIYKDSTELIKSTGRQLLEYFNLFTEINPEFGTTDELWILLTRDLKAENYSMLCKGITFTAYEKVRGLFGAENQDIYQLLTRLFTQENALNGGLVGLERLKGKSVAFLITELDIRESEFALIKEAYNEIHRKKEFEIIWIPMVADPSVQWGDVERRTCTALTGKMPWYWCEPSMLTKDFSSYIRQEWYFQKKSTLVVLDNYGKLVSILTLVAKWGPSPFPWTWEISPSPPEPIPTPAPAPAPPPAPAPAPVDTFNRNSSSHTLVRIKCRSGPLFLTIEHGRVIFSKSGNNQDQIWILLSKPAYGSGCVCLINKGTGEALQHRGGYKHVQLVSYSNVVNDPSLVWRRSPVFDQYYREVMPQNDSSLRLDASSGGSEGSSVVVWYKNKESHNGYHQQWNMARA